MNSRHGPFVAPNQLAQSHDYILKIATSDATKFNITPTGAGAQVRR